MEVGPMKEVFINRKLLYHAE